MHEYQPLTSQPRIAYYLWHFPVLTETFIRREILALRGAGVQVQVFADGSDPLDLLDEEARAQAGTTRYLEPDDTGTAVRRHLFFGLTRPASYLLGLLRALRHRHGARKHWRDDLRLFARAVLLAGALKEAKVSHVHAPWANRCAFSAMIAARLLNIPYSVQARASADLYRSTQAFALEEKFARAKFVITNSRFNESYIRRFMPQRRWPKISVIYNGLDLAGFEAPERVPDRKAVLRLLTVATVGVTKGLTVLLEACRQFRQRGYRFTCEIVGTEHALYPDYARDVRALAAELEDCVALAGPRPFPAVVAHYRSADVFVLPCVVAEDGSRDVTPNALIEAMAMKLAVVSTRITGIPEIVEHGVDGILVEPNSPAGLVDALVALAEDPALRAALGHRARAKVEARFDVHKNIGRYVDLFTSTGRRA